jgi:hypothetical protein
LKEEIFVNLNFKTCRVDGFSNIPNNFKIPDYSAYCAAVMEKLLIFAFALKSYFLLFLCHNINLLFVVKLRTPKEENIGGEKMLETPFMFL